MRNASPLLALVVDTFRESFARKIFWGFIGCSTAMILFFLLVLHIDVVEGSLAALTIFGRDVTGGQAVDVEHLVTSVLGGIAAFLFGLGLLLAIFAAAGMIPTVFEPGRIELLLSKPISRVELLLGKYLGTLAVIGCNLFYLVLGVWVILGWKTQIWKVSFLYSALLALFAFAVLLTVVTFVAVVSGSAVLATMVTYFLLLMSVVVAQHERIAPLFNSQWPRDLVKWLYYLLPKVFELGDMSRRALMGQRFDTWLPLWSSAAFALVALAAGLWMFGRKDY